MAENLKFTTTNITTTYSGVSSSQYIGSIFFQSTTIRDYFVSLLNVRKSIALRLATSSGVITVYSCTPSFNGTINITQRVITPVLLEIRVQECVLVLQNAWQNSEDTRAFLSKDLPQDFQTWIMQELINQASSQLERLAWEGNTASTSGDVVITAVNGVHTIAAGDAGTIKVGTPLTTINGSNAISEVARIYNLLPYELIQRDDLVIFLSKSFYVAYKQAFYQTFPNNSNYNVMAVPGNLTYLNIPVIATPMTGVKALATFANKTNGNLYFATNISDEETKIEVIDKRIIGEDNILYRAVWEAGFEIGLATEVVVYGAATA